MPHRGRLNVLATTVGKPLSQIFAEFEGNDPSSYQGSGDVKYHLGATGTHLGDTGETITVTVAPNPSHLEFVDPVVEGMVRAKQDAIGDREHARVLPVLLHGDAAFAGQGVVAETMHLSGLHGYRTGGTIHVVVNNQIGFTTLPEDSRSSTYATDVAKMVHAPAFHVNGDDPEAVAYVAGLALEYRQKFRKDVVDRHGVLPALGPQRDRRAELHPADHVREDQDPPLRRDALRREAGARGGRDPRGARADLGREEGRDAVGEEGRRDALRRDRAARAGRARLRSTPRRCGAGSRRS